MVFSTFSKSLSNSKESAFIGSCISKVIFIPIPKGNNPFLVTFQQLLIVTGTTKADGADLVSIFSPFSEKLFGTPSLLLVPSG